MSENKENEVKDYEVKKKGPHRDPFRRAGSVVIIDNTEFIVIKPHGNGRWWLINKQGTEARLLRDFQGCKMDLQALQNLAPMLTSFPIYQRTRSQVKTSRRRRRQATLSPSPTSLMTSFLPQNTDITSSPSSPPQQNALKRKLEPSLTLSSSSSSLSSPPSESTLFFTQQLALLQEQLDRERKEKEEIKKENEEIKKEKEEILEQAKKLQKRLTAVEYEAEQRGLSLSGTSDIDSNSQSSGSDHDEQQSPVLYDQQSSSSYFDDDTDSHYGGGEDEYYEDEAQEEGEKQDPLGGGKIDVSGNIHHFSSPSSP